MQPRHDLRVSHGVAATVKWDSSLGAGSLSLEPFVIRRNHRARRAPNGILLLAGLPTDLTLHEPSSE
jgi:hypothetical protein